MTPAKLFFLKVAVGLVAIFLVGEYVKRRIIDSVDWNSGADQKATETKVAVDSVIYVDRTTAPARARYIETRDRVKADPKPSKPLVDTLIADADSARAADSLRIAKRDTALAKSAAEIAHLKNRPGDARLTAYTEGLWDAIGQRPVVRAGADFRIVKGLSLHGALDATLNEKPRAMIGARWTFR